MNIISNIQRSTLKYILSSEQGRVKMIKFVSYKQNILLVSMGRIYCLYRFVSVILSTEKVGVGWGENDE